MNRKAIIALASLIMLCSCNGNVDLPMFVEDDCVRLVFGRTEPFRFNPLSCQLAFNRDRCEFRAHTDNMSDFFIAKFDSVPEHENQEVVATVIWTTDASVETRKNVTLKVVGLEGDKVWLWGESARLAMTIQILY